MERAQNQVERISSKEEVAYERGVVGVRLGDAYSGELKEVRKAGERGVYSKKDLDAALEKINQYAELQQVSLQLKVEKELQQVVISVVDRDTDEIIRQIPSDHAIALAKRIDEVVEELSAGESEQIITLLDAKA